MENEGIKNLNGSFPDENQWAEQAHLSDEEIIAYLYGSLPSAEIELRAQDHLIDCRRCANLLLELNAFAESTIEETSASRENVDLEWAQLRERIPFESTERKESVKSDSKSQKDFFNFLSFNFARMAALAAIVILAFGAIVLVLRQTVTNESQVARQTEPVPRTDDAPNFPGVQNDIEPGASRNNSETAIPKVDSDYKNSSRARQKASPATSPVPRNTPRNESARQPSAPEKDLALNTADSELYPDEAVRNGGAADLRKIRVEPSARLIRLKLKTASTVKLADVRAEITNSQNKVVFTKQLAGTRNGDLVLSLPAKSLPAGVYSLKIYGVRNGRSELFSEYGFALEYK